METAFEPHYSIGQLATQWDCGRETIRKIVKDEPGVLKLKFGLKKTNVTYKVPESVARRIHTRLLNAA